MFLLIHLTIDPVIIGPKEYFFTISLKLSALLFEYTNIKFGGYFL